MTPALKYKSEVGADGEVILPRLNLTQGTPVEIIVLIRESESGDQNGFRKLSAETMDYWDNAIDDEVWNNASTARHRADCGSVRRLE